MRLTAAFFANKAEVINDMLNVEGGFWNSTTVDSGAAGFHCYIVVVCEVDARDVGQQFSLYIDGEGPSGHRWSPAHSSDFTLESPILFMCLPLIILPMFGSGFVPLASCFAREHAIEG